MYWWKELLFVSSNKVCFQFQNFVSCSVSYNINWIVTQIGFFPGPHICSKALTGVGRGITSPFHGDFYFNFHLSWLMCKSWMLQRLEKLICLVRSFSMSCDIFDLHICQDRWKLENWCLLLTQVDCQRINKWTFRVENSAHFWRGVGNFKLHFFSHFFFKFENLSAHFVANILNSSKHPRLLHFGWVWR